jgi:hypothetical protein
MEWWDHSTFAAGMWLCLVRRNRNGKYACFKAVHHDVNVAMDERGVE